LQVGGALRTTQSFPGERTLRQQVLELVQQVDRLVLRLATYELLADPGTPSRVVINEALELARTYSGEEAVRFVNGVLDAVRKELRPE